MVLAVECVLRRDTSTPPPPHPHPPLLGTEDCSALEVPRGI